MPTGPVFTRVLSTGWCALVLVVSVLGYLGLSLIVVSVVEEPVLATILLNVVIVTTIGLVRLKRPWWLDYRPSPPPIQPREQFVAATTAAIAMAFLGGQALALWLYATIGSPGFDDSARTRAAAPVLATLLLTLVIAPAAEELMFRGAIYPLLRRRAGILVSAVTAAGTFGLMHGNVVQLVSTLPLALVLALVYERTRAIWPCMLLHGAYNLAATVVPPVLLTLFANPASASLLLLGLALAAARSYRLATGPAVDDKHPARSMPTERVPPEL